MAAAVRALPLALSGAALVAGVAVALSAPRGRFGRARRRDSRQLPLPGFPADLPPPVTVQVGARRVPRSLAQLRPIPPGFKMKLSRTQFAELFPRLARIPTDIWPKARCGLWGCVYPRGPKGTPEAGEVVKFTADKDEAFAAERLRENPIRGALPVKGVYKLRNVPVFAIVARRFEKPGKLARIVSAACNSPFVRWRLRGDPADLLRFTGCVESYAYRVTPPLDPKRAVAFAERLVSTVTDLELAGIEWGDLHAGNLTQDQRGDPVIIDIGPRIFHPGPESVRELARPRRA